MNADSAPTADAPLPPGPGLDRRKWFLAAAGVALVGTGGAFLLGRCLAGDGGTEPGPASEPGSLEWALGLCDFPVEELVRWAGDLERVTQAHPDAASLAPCFERLLDELVPLRQRPEYADMALACAVRSLARLGQRDALHRHRAAIIVDPELIETRAALVSEQARERRH